jgi:biotin synthase
LREASPDGVRLNCHAGLVSADEAAEIARWADIVSFDFVSDPRVIQEVYGLSRSPEDYIDTYMALSNRVRTVPHICIGLAEALETGGSLHSGNPDSEIGAVEALRGLVDSGRAPLPPALVFIIFTPTRGTRFESKPPPSLALVGAVLARAREVFPDIPINLGCMRPTGDYRTQVDTLAIRCGVNLIVQPSAGAFDEARLQGLRVIETYECCVFEPTRSPGVLKIRASSGTAAALGLLPLKSLAAPTTAYVMVGDKCARDCAFCAQARSSTDGEGKLSRVTWPEVPRDAFANALAQAARSGRVHRACAQVVGGLDALAAAVEAVRFLRQTGGAGFPVSVSFSATSGEKDVEALLEAGADRVALPLDACEASIYQKVKGHDMSRALELILRCARAFPGRIGTHLIAGLGESEEDLIRLASRMFDAGVGVGLFAFTPLPGTRLAGAPPPDIGSYRRVQLCLYLMRQGLALVGDFDFRGGTVRRIAIPAETVMKAALSGEPFRTSGCPDCNRPFYNERPGGTMYNYPEPLEARDAETAAETALIGVELGD